MNRTEINSPSTTRIEAFSDGVLAIVITLMVLEIKLPQLAEEISNKPAWQALQNLSVKLLAYALSFLMVALFWINHHELFHQIRYGAPGLLWLNTLWLFFICLLPFPTAFLGEHPHLELSSLIFAIEMFCCSITFFGIRLYSFKYGLSNISTAQATKDLQRSAIAPSLYLLAAALSWWSVYVSFTIFILVPSIFIVTSLTQSKK